MNIFNNQRKDTINNCCYASECNYTLSKARRFKALPDDCESGKNNSSKQ